LRRGPFGKGPNRNEFLLKKARFSGDVPKLTTIIANYTSESLFTTWILHLEGEEVFGSAKRDVNFSSSANEELHRLNHVNFSHLCVAILACQPNNVNDLSIPKSPCVAQSMFPILFQGGITINRLCVGMAFGILINALLIMLCNVLHCKKIPM
jgi:hypothetical protein